MGEMRNLYRILVGKPEGKIPILRPRRRWENNIKTDRKEIEFAMWIRFMWLRIETGGGLLWTRY
jgi:hypothetical protein